MKKIASLFKVVMALGVAFVVLNIVSVFYYNVPIHASSDTKSTDYVWEENKFYSRGTEGFAWGVTDANGFNNLKTFEKGQIDVLVMGSSHMEALNVAQDKNTVSVLNEKFNATGLDLNAYNIGISGHELPRCINNLENAIGEFAPNEYVVIETQSILPSSDLMKKVLDGTLKPIASHEGGILGALQKFPYLRLVYSQYKNSKNDGSSAKAVENKEEQQKYLDSLINKASQTCEKAGVKLIIFYNCSIKVDDKGDVIEKENAEDIIAFEEICKNYGVTFIDMYDAFKDNYKETYKLPRGFSNSKAGTGHLNEEGHRVIAETLYSEIVG